MVIFTDSPSETDPVIWNPQLICEDILGSEFFELLGLVPNDVRKIYLNWNQQGYSAFFSQVYDSSNLLDSYESTYPYKLREFSKMTTFHHLREYLFVCPATDTSEKNVMVYPYYVSKEYNVGLLGQSFKSGRFVFSNFIPGRRDSYDIVILAEEPAIVHTEPSFNIELHYLHIRKYIDPGEFIKS